MDALDFGNLRNLLLLFYDFGVLEFDFCLCCDCNWIFIYFLLFSIGGKLPPSAYKPGEYKAVWILDLFLFC